MQKQAVKTLSFAFHGVSFDVVPTGNKDADFNIGTLITVLYLKIQRDNYNDTKPFIPKPELLPDIIFQLATNADFVAVLKGFLFSLDVFLQPLSHTMRSSLDHLEVEKLITDIENPNHSDADYPASLKNTEF